MLNEGNEWMKASAIYVLGEIGNDKSCEILKKYFNEKHDVIRRNIAIALGKLAAKKVCNSKEHFKKFLNSEDENDRMYAVKAINNLKLKEFIPELVRMIGDEGPGELKQLIRDTLDKLLD
jgi:HEAT repeat protein